MLRKLQYFELNGLAESIRYILHYGNLKFEDVKYEINTWPIKTVKDSLPYGQLPHYTEGARSLNQSLAIARYVAHQVDLVPTDAWEQAVLDATVYNIYDFYTHVRSYVVEKDIAKKTMLKKQIINENIDFYFSRFEKELKAKNGHFGGKLTYADFVFVGIVEATNLFLCIEVEKKYPTVMTLINKIQNLAGVREYIATRKPYVF